MNYKISFDLAHNPQLLQYLQAYRRSPDASILPYVQSLSNSQVNVDGTRVFIHVEGQTLRYRSSAHPEQLLPLPCEEMLDYDLFFFAEDYIKRETPSTQLKLQANSACKMQLNIIPKISGWDVQLMLPPQDVYEDEKSLGFSAALSVTYHFGWPKHGPCVRRQLLAISFETDSLLLATLLHPRFTGQAFNQPHFNNFIKLESVFNKVLAQANNARLVGAPSLVAQAKRINQLVEETHQALTERIPLGAVKAKDCRDLQVLIDIVTATRAALDEGKLGPDAVAAVADRYEQMTALVAQIWRRRSGWDKIKVELNAFACTLRDGVGALIGSSGHGTPGQALTAPVRDSGKVAIYRKDKELLLSAMRFFRLQLGNGHSQAAEVAAEARLNPRRR